MQILTQRLSDKTSYFGQADRFVHCRFRLVGNGRQQIAQSREMLASDQRGYSSYIVCRARAVICSRTI
jgi:hypothetical protein